MRILYGVNGEGLGHAIRSNVVAYFLASKGHQIQFLTSKGRAAIFLESQWPGQVVCATGLNMVMDQNSVSQFATFALNAGKQFLASPIVHLMSALQVRVPDVVISDFDPWTARYAKLFSKPLVAVDNVHFMSKCFHGLDMVSLDRQAASLMYPIVSEMVPRAKRYLVTTIASAPILDRNVTLHLPIVRSKVSYARGAAQKDHVVVYFNDKAQHRAVLGALREHPNVEFRVYGIPGVTEVLRSGNVSVLPLSEDGFLGDLASSRAVIGGAGFTLISEAIVLGKPILARPFEGQFEQILNANYVTRLGFGERARNLEPSTIRGFLARSDDFSSKLAGFKHDGNAELLSAVEAAIS
jgi:uncharacterized protein (TIGR00661 family)